MKNNDFLTVKEAAEYLKINEKKLYELASNGLIPATKSTGKWLFPLENLKAFLKRDALKNLKSSGIERLIDEGIMIFAGSDDVILSKIFNDFHSEYDDLEIYYSSVGSFKGLKLLQNMQCQGAAAHIFDNETDDYNFPYADKILGEESYTIINLFYRDVGFVSKNIEISSFKDIAEGNLIFINRQINSGVRNLSDSLIRDEEIVNLKFFNREMSTHFDIAQTVDNTERTVGIACKTAASAFHLNFNKILEERFDLIIRKEIFFKENFQKFINFLRKKVKNTYENLDGYSFYDSGEIMFKKK